MDLELGHLARRPAGVGGEHQAHPACAVVCYALVRAVRQRRRAYR
ncbi:hypothetical protein ACIHEI_18940 [Kitasatospora sp. NPDC051984]